MQHSFPKIRGGGSKAVWNFSKNSSDLVAGSFPHNVLDICKSGKPNVSLQYKLFLIYHHNQKSQLYIWYYNIQEECGKIKRMYFSGTTLGSLSSPTFFHSPSWRLVTSGWAGWFCSCCLELTLTSQFFATFEFPKYLWGCCFLKTSFGYRSIWPSSWNRTFLTISSLSRLEEMIGISCVLPLYT